MKKILVFILAFILKGYGQAQPNIAAGNLQSSDSPNYRGSGNGMMFIQNNGQIVDMLRRPCPDVLFKSDGGGADIYLRKTGISYVLNNKTEIDQEVNEQIEESEKKGRLTQPDKQKLRQEFSEKQMIKLHRIDVDFMNCNPTPTIQTTDQVDGYSNYYYPHCPNGITHVSSWSEVTMKNIYKNIDVVYFGGRKNGLKYDIIVNPGGNPNDIKLKYNGTEELKIENGKLIIETSLGQLGEYMPKVYQNIDGKIIDVKAHYAIEGTIVNLKLETWNPEFPLVIDPWASYYMSNGSDYSNAVATDANANVVFTGFTNSASLPVSAGAFQTLSTTIIGKDDVYVVKMDVNGTRIFATYIGGTTGWEFGEGIATDASGNIFSTGFTESTDFPVGAIGANVVHQNTHNGVAGWKDAFLFKFDPMGLRLWGTYYGGPGTDGGGGVATDGTNVYLTGYTNSTTAISTAGSFQAAYSGTGNDVFVAKFAPNGSRIWGTYFGGTDNDGTHSASCTPSGDICVGGWTSSIDFPVSAGCYQAANAGGSDAFIFKLNPTGGRIWATYYGGAASEGGHVTTDGLGNAILSGSTSSTASIASAGAYQVVYGTGTSDGYVAKFNSAGVLQWATYLGGNMNDFVLASSTDGKNNIYAFGEAEDTDMGTYPITPCAYQPGYGGVEDNFITKLDPNGKLTCSTYIGGTKEDDLDQGGGIAVYANSYIYITGHTNGGYPVTAGAFQTTSSALGDYDAFINQLCINICEAKTLSLNFSTNLNSVCKNVPITFTPTVANTCDTTGYRYKWYFPGGNPSSSTALNPVVTYPAAGNYSARYVLTTICKKDSVVKNNFINISPCDSTATTLSVCPNICTNITAIGATGTSPYTYSWSPGSGTAKTINVCPLTSTTYTVKITDALGVTSTKTTIVTVHPQLNVSASVTNNVLCGGANSGSATANPNSGVSPYSFFWNNSQTTQSTTGLIAGNYTVTVTDQNSCTSSQTINITQSQPLVISAASANIDCSTNGTASITISNGVAPFSYTWSNGQAGSTTTVSGFAATTSISGLVAGNYSVTVTDGNGCTQSIPFIITGSTPGVSAAFTQPSSICINSLADFLNSGTTGAGVTYSWSITPTSPGVSGTTNNFSYTFLTAGNYSVAHTVNSGTCKATITKNITVYNCTGPIVTATGSSVCPGSCASVTSSGAGGSSPYTYSWSTGATTQNIIPCPITTTIYTVTVTDTGGNTSTSTAVVTINPPVSASTTSTNITCNGGTGSAAATGGSGSSPYAYSWSNGGTTSQISNLTSQIYTVTVTDNKGCMGTSTVSIVSPPPLDGQFVKGTANCTGCGCKEWVMVNAAGGTSPYSYTWPDGYINRYKNQLCPGAYTINIKDKNGCSVNVNLNTP